MPRPRKWTDEQLREAVAASSTWQEVVLKIGRTDSPKARRVVQGHAIRLALDVSHLPTFKPVDPVYPHDLRFRNIVDDLVAAVPECDSWAQVFRRVGITPSGSGYVSLRNKAMALGLDTSHFRGQSWGSRPVDAVAVPFSRDRDLELLRNAATARATAWFMERGYTVCVPVEPTLYDLVVDSDEGLVRVQVKSTISRDRNGRWVVRIHRMAYDSSAKHTSSGARARCVYAPGEIDFFFIVTAAGDNYLIPLAVTKGAAALTLDSKYAAFKVA
jgi:PD-(D/E)XK endonuclease